MLNSLFGRLLLASLFLLGVFFSLIYYAINQAFITNTLDAKQEQLLVQNYLLLAAANVENNTIIMPDTLQESRFDNHESGLYGIIHDLKGNIFWRSPSSENFKTNYKLLNTSLLLAGTSEFRLHDNFYLSHYRVQWEVVDDQVDTLIFTVIENNATTQDKITAFQQSVQQLFGFSAIAMVIALLLILRWGTLPLRDLAREIKTIESGDKSRIQGKYPLELEGLSQNLNELIDTSDQQRTRYKNTLSDLAHSLKHH